MNSLIFGLTLLLAVHMVTVYGLIKWSLFST